MVDGYVFNFQAFLQKAIRVEECSNCRALGREFLRASREMELRLMFSLTLSSNSVSVSNNSVSVSNDV